MRLTLRTSGKGKQYRYYTCSTTARQGQTGCKGRSVPMDKLDGLVAEHLEKRLLDPARLEEILAAILHRRQDRAERRQGQVANLRRQTSEAQAKLKRLYEAIEAGVADLGDPMLKARIAELTALRDQAQAEADRAEGAGDKLSMDLITPEAVKRFAAEARKRMRLDGGGYRRDHLRALAQRVEVDDTEVRIIGSKTDLLRTLSATSSAKSAPFGVRTFVRNWRPLGESNPCYRRERAVS